MTKNKNQAVIPAAALSRALNVVSRGAGKDGLYEMMQVDVKNSTLTVQCFNGIMGVSVQTAVEDQGSGMDAMINAQALVSLVSNMSGAVTISQETRKGLRVECESVSVTLKGTQAGTLPELEDGKAKDVCSMSGEPPHEKKFMFPERNRGARGVYCNWQTYKPYKAMETRACRSPELHLGFRSK